MIIFISYFYIFIKSRIVLFLYFLFYFILFLKSLFLSHYVSNPSQEVLFNLAKLFSFYSFDKRGTSKMNDPISLDKHNYP